jgi:hypothetical protein
VIRDNGAFREAYSRQLRKASYLPR